MLNLTFTLSRQLRFCLSIVLAAIRLRLILIFVERQEMHKISEVNQLISNGMAMMIWIYIDGTTSQDLVKVRGILMNYLNC